jgi:hypothetical protein
MPDTVLSPNECAIVSTDNMTDIKVLLPDLPDGVAVPPVMAFLLACATRFRRDPNFVDEQIRWLDEVGDYVRNVRR